MGFKMGAPLELMFAGGAFESTRLFPMDFLLMTSEVVAALKLFATFVAPVRPDRKEYLWLADVWNR